MPHVVSGGHATYVVVRAGPGSLLGHSPVAIPPAVGAELSRHGGTLLGWAEADGLCAVFARPADAIAAVTAWGPGDHSLSVRVRVGIHSGTAQPEDPWAPGSALHLSAGLAALAHGGQTLLSADAAALVEQSLPPGLELEPLGTHRLRDLHTTVRVVQLRLAQGMPVFPGPLSLDSLPHNIPVQVTSFMGRQQAFASLTQHVCHSRLVTITGPGGNGKTRMSLQVAAYLLDQFPDGAWLVDLTNLTDGAQVLQAVAAVLKVREEPGRPLADTLCAALQNRRMLLLLDNCEHLIVHCARLASTLLIECPQVHILATSREPLGIAGETAWATPPLAVPDSDEELSVEAVSRCEAVRFFIDRARAVNPSFAVTMQNVAALSTVCRRLDGVPLALELAAARIRVLSVEQIAERLDDRLRLLTSGLRSTLPRHQTMRAAIDWSHDLLTLQERLLWRRLSVFAGSFSLEAAEAVCAHSGVEPFEVLDLLAQLVDKSLVLSEEHLGEKRFRLLDTMRQYALERLREAGEEEAVSRAHLTWYVSFALQAEAELGRQDRALWLDRLALENGNLREAVKWAMEQGALDEAKRICGAIWRYWYLRGQITENLERMKWLAAAPQGTGSDRQAHGQLLNGMGALCFYLGELREAEIAYRQSLTIFREQGNRDESARVLNNLGVGLRVEVRLDEALACLEEALILNRESGQSVRESWTLNNLGTVYYERGDLPAARRFHEQSLEIQRRLGDQAGIAMSSYYLGLISIRQRGYQAAQSQFEAAAAIARELGDRRLLALALDGLGGVAFHMGDYAACRALQRESIRIQQVLGDLVNIAGSLENFAWLLAAEGELVQAMRLAGGAAALRRRINAPLSPLRTADMEERLGPARRAMGEQEAATAMEAGSRLTLEQLLDLACTAGQAPDPTHQEQPASPAESLEPGTELLTPRELQIVRMSAKGLTTREIGERLFLSHRTIEKHEENIRHKLNVPNRSALVAWAVRRGLVSD